MIIQTDYRKALFIWERKIVIRAGLQFVSLILADIAIVLWLFP